MRDRETIDEELRRVALGRRSIREQGGQPSSREVDQLLDELLAHSASSSGDNAPKASDTGVVADISSRRDRTATSPRRRNGALRRFGILAALPLSLLAGAVAVVLMSSARHQDSRAQPTEPPPSPAPTQSVAPKAPAPRVDVTDMAFVAALKHEGVPVPSQEYVTSQGHAVCDFLAHRPNFADAVGFVQQSSIWDANQSADVTAGAIVSYCPQSQPAMVAGAQPAYDNTLADLQAIQGKLQGIQGNLHDIQGGLEGLDGLLGHP